MPISFDNTYAKLPERFYSPETPTAVRAPELIRVNHALAKHLGIDPLWLESDAGIAVLAGNTVPEGAAPISQAYAGHQFANFVPQLGDGRAIMLGEVVAADDKRYDIQLKGSGLTYWSRRGDGCSALGPVLREYIVSEAMHALGVPTTRALAAVTTGEDVFRGDMQAGGVFTRVASSHIRVGTFQYFAARGDNEALRALADYTIARHYPEATESDAPYIALFKAVIVAQIQLIPKWLGFGFIHGVMNTDNCAISGETIDYGPCAFMEQFYPHCVFSSIDQQGRYAWGNQAQIAHWNLARFGETLLPIIDPNRDKAIKQAEEALADFSTEIQRGYFNTFVLKLGLDRYDKRAANFVKSTLEKLAQHQVDFTLFFSHLTRIVEGADSTEFVDLWDNASAAHRWLESWKKLSIPEALLPEMKAANPIRIPRNHQVERVIKSGYKGEFSHFHRLVEALADPFSEQSEYADLEAAAKPEERVYETFCGT